MRARRNAAAAQTVAKLGERRSVELVGNESRRGARGNAGARFRDGGGLHAARCPIRRKGSVRAMLGADIAGRRGRFSVLVPGDVMCVVTMIAVCAMRGRRLLLVTAGAIADGDARESAQRHHGHQSENHQNLQPVRHEKHYDKEYTQIENESDFRGLHVGDLIEHSTFGTGRISAVTGRGEGTKVAVRFFRDNKQRDLMVKYANLKKM